MGSNASSGHGVGGAGRGNRADSFSSAYPGVAGSGSGSGALSVTSAFRSRSGAPSIRSLSFNPGGSSSHGHGAGGSGPEQRVYINEWKAPVAPTLPSTLKEEEQLEACIAYIARVESDLTTHNELRQPMLALYSGGGKAAGYSTSGAGGGSSSTNGAKALANWERKSNHLLAELVRWQGYVEGLNNALRLKGEKRDERAMETALARADEEMAKVKEGEEGGPIPLS